MEKYKKIVKALAAIHRPIIGCEAYLVLGNGGRVKTSDVISVYACKGETRIETQNTVYVINEKPWYPFSDIYGHLEKREIAINVHKNRWQLVKIQPKAYYKCIEMNQCAIETESAVYFGELYNGEFITINNSAPLFVVDEKEFIKGGKNGNGNYYCVSSY